MVPYFQLSKGSWPHSAHETEVSHRQHQENSPFLSKRNNLSWHNPAVPTLTFCLECALGIQFSYKGGKVQNLGPTDSKTPAPTHGLPQTERK